MTVVAGRDMSLIDTCRLNAARANAERAGTRLARAEQHVAATTLRRLFGATAARLVLDKDVNDHGDTDITVLLVLDSDGRLLWFNSDDAYGYPGTKEITGDRGRPVGNIGWPEQWNLEQALERVYDAAGGCYAALDVADGVHFWAFFGYDMNLLVFDVTAALAGRRSGAGRLVRGAVRRGWTVMGSMVQRIRSKGAVR